MNGLGFIIPDTSTLPTTTQTQAKPKDGSTFNNIASGISNLFNSAAPIVQAVVKPNSPGTPGYNPLLPASSAFNPPAPPAETKTKNNALKYGIIAAATVGGGFLLYKLAKKKKSALGTAGLQPYNGGLGAAKKKRTRKRKK